MLLLLAPTSHCAMTWESGENWDSLWPLGNTVDSSWRETLGKQMAIIQNKATTEKSWRKVDSGCQSGGGNPAEESTSEKKFGVPGTLVSRGWAVSSKRQWVSRRQDFEQDFTELCRTLWTSSWSWQRVHWKFLNPGVMLGTPWQTLGGTWTNI